VFTRIYIIKYNIGAVLAWLRIKHENVEYFQSAIRNILFDGFLAFIGHCIFYRWEVLPATKGHNIWTLYWYFGKSIHGSFIRTHGFPYFS